MNQLIDAFILFVAKTVKLPFQLNISCGDSQTTQNKHLGGGHGCSDAMVSILLEFIPQDLKNLLDIRFRGIRVKRKLLAKKGKMYQTFHSLSLKQACEKLITDSIKIQVTITLPLRFFP